MTLHHGSWHLQSGTPRDRDPERRDPPADPPREPTSDEEVTEWTYDSTAPPARRRRDDAHKRVRRTAAVPGTTRGPWTR